MALYDKIIDGGSGSQILRAKRRALPIDSTLNGQFVPGANNLVKRKPRLFGEGKMVEYYADEILDDGFMGFIKTLANGKDYKGNKVDGKRYEAIVATAIRAQSAADSTHRETGA